MSYRTPLERHAAYFADSDNKLTYDHMIKVQADINSTGYFKSKGAADAIMVMLDKHNQGHTPEALASIPNSAASGLWATDGHLNEDAFQRLVGNYSEWDKYSASSIDVRVISKAMFKAFLKNEHSLDSRELVEKNNTRDFSAIKVVQCPYLPSPRFGISRQQVTDASIDRLFDDFYDRNLDHNEKFITVENLRLFYEDSPAFFRKFKSGSG